MKENWLPSFDRVIRSEGGFRLTNIPGDRGGQTYAGIARRPNPDWEGWAVIDRGGVPPVEAVARFYKARFWDRVRGDDLPHGVDYLVYDFAVNAGAAQAVRLLQRAVGVPDDGRIGPVTLSAVRARPPLEVASAFKEQKEAFYRRLVESDPTQNKFIRGWLNRVAHVDDAVRGMLA